MEESDGGGGCDVDGGGLGAVSGFVKGEAAKIADGLPGGVVECAAEVEEGPCAGAVGMGCIWHVVHGHNAEAEGLAAFRFECFDRLKDYGVECAFGGAGEFAEDACGVAGAGATSVEGVEEDEGDGLGCD